MGLMLREDLTALRQASKLSYRAFYRHIYLTKPSHRQLAKSCKTLMDSNLDVEEVVHELMIDTREPFC
jgi:hypothetical protein